jgi:tetratricopeptide (TPR) repeat protein
MPSKVAFTRSQTNPIAIIPKLLFYGLLCLCFYPVDQKAFFMIGLFAYIMLAALARWIFFPNSLYENTKMLRQAKFAEAIPLIQKTIDYYAKHQWIDRYKYALQISSSRWSIIETSICNMDYCYLQIGNVEKSKEIYAYVLEENPENFNARNMSNTINIVEHARSSKLKT